MTFQRITVDPDICGGKPYEHRVVITADLDFPRLLALASAEGPGLILFRGGNYSDAERCERLEASICVVDRRRVRLTRLPLL